MAMTRKKKSPENKRNHDIKIALTPTEYEQVVEWAKDIGYAPAVFARLATLGTMPKVPPLNLSAWKEVGLHLGHLDRLLQVLEVIQIEAISPPPTLTELIQQEILQLRSACSALLKRSLAPEDNSHDS
jgi:hypothetical protein